MRLQSACLLLLLAGAAPAMAADATTYQGTIGKLQIIAELSEPGPDGTFFGRYSYVSKGVDIPLHGKSTTEGAAFTLEEEKPCTEALCKKEDVVLDVAPIGAEWTLSAEGETLAGSWIDKDSGKTLPVTLEAVGKRSLPADATGFDMLDPSYATGAGTPPVLTPADLPYDFLRLDRPLKLGEVETIGKAVYRLDADTRTELPYPVVVKLGSADPQSLNSFLRQQRLQFSMSVFSCLSRAYLGFGWTGQGGEGSNGYEGGATVTVDHLTPRLLGYTETGSFWCGGAHPDNTITRRFADARTGEPLVAETLLKGWIARDEDGAPVDPAGVEDPSLLTYGPDEKLQKYVKAHLDKGLDPEMIAECDMDDLIRSSLGVYFTRKELVFTFKDLPNVAAACTEDLVKVPLKDAGRFLTKDGARYFAELD